MSFSSYPHLLLHYPPALIPPLLPFPAPLQAVIVPIWKKEEEREAVLGAAAAVEGTLKKGGIRVKLDASDQRTPGWKFNHWEMKVRGTTALITVPGLGVH